MNYAQKAFLYTATALTMFAQGCKKTDDPTSKPVEPKVEYKSVTLRMDPDASSSIDLSAVLNPAVAGNDAKGFGHIYDLRLYQSSFKAMTSVSPVLQDVYEAFTIDLNVKNIKENNSATLLEPVHPDSLFATLTAVDNEFYRDEFNKKSVKAYKVYIRNGIKVTNILKGWTASRAVINGQDNFAADPNKYKRTLNLTNPSSLPEVSPQ